VNERAIHDAAPDLVGIAETARMLGVSESTVRRNTFGLRVLRKPGLNGRRYYRSDVLRLRSELFGETETAGSTSP
jgi:hypothetical protein